MSKTFNISKLFYFEAKHLKGDLHKHGGTQGGPNYDNLSDFISASLHHKLKHGLQNGHASGQPHSDLAKAAASAPAKS